MRELNLFFVYVLLLLFGLTVAPSPVWSCEVTGEESTAFERIIARTCGLVPYPIEAFGKLLKVEPNIVSLGDLVTSGGHKTGIDFFRIPYGRSLVRSHTDLNHPRYVTEFSYLSNGLKGGFLPLLYLGFTPNTQQIEVISWNDLERIYEFYLVENYGSPSAKVVRPARGTCTACHQNGGPIFPRDPWTEMEGSSQFSLSIKISDKQPGAPKASSKPGPLVYDSRVRQSAMALKIADVCQSVCRDTKCKANFMAALIWESLSKVQVNLSSIGSLSFPRSADRAGYSLEQFFKDHPENQMDQIPGRPSSVIPDRNTNRSYVRTIRLKLVPGTDRISPDFYKDDITDSAALFSSGTVDIPDSHPAADPLTPRPLQKLNQAQLKRNAATAIKVCYGTWKYQIEELRIDLPTLIQNVRNSPLADPYFAKPWRTSEQTLDFLRGQSPKEEVQASREVLNLGQPKSRPPQVILKQVCGACHGSGPHSIGSGGYELPLDSAAQLRAYGTKSPGMVLRLIRNQSMPPLDPQNSISSEERERLIRFIETQ